MKRNYLHKHKILPANKIYLIDVYNLMCVRACVRACVCVFVCEKFKEILNLSLCLIAIRTSNEV